MRGFFFHVKTELSVDDAQIYVVPNVAWAALAKIARGHGCRGWLGRSSSALERASLPLRASEEPNARKPNPGR